MGDYYEPYPYILRKAPYIRIIARYLFDPYCILGHGYFGENLPLLVPALINWGMSHWITPKLVGPHLARTTAVMAQYISDRALQPENILVFYDGVTLSPQRFDEKDYATYDQARNDAGLAKAYLQLLREQTK